MKKIECRIVKKIYPNNSVCYFIEQKQKNIFGKWKWKTVVEPYSSLVITYNTLREAQGALCWHDGTPTRIEIIDNPYKIRFNE